MKKKFTAGFAILTLLFSGVVFAQKGGRMSVSDFTHRQDGVDHVFEITLSNNSEDDILASGRLVVLNVYDTSPPISLPIQNVALPAGGADTVRVVWSSAPFLGQVRTLLVMNDGSPSPTVVPYDFWLIPWQGLLILLGMIALVLAGFAIVHRLTHAGKDKEKNNKSKKDNKDEIPKKKKKPRRRVPDDMVLYTVEYDDTVVTIAERFGVTWEDVVRANKLKPPYDLKPDKDILIPKHDLIHPKEE